MLLAIPSQVRGSAAHPIRFICPFPAGGVVDAATRTVAIEVGAALGQPVIVENYVGANGAIAAQRLHASAVDGSTLMMATFGTSLAQLMRPKQFPPPEGLKGVALIAHDIPILVASPTLPAENLEQFIAVARRTPGSLNYLRTGVGSFSHVVLETLKRAVNIDVESVDYRGLPQGVLDLLAGRIHLAVVNVGLVLPHIRENRLSAIAAVGPQRAEELPDLPTLGEQGVDIGNLAPWVMMVAHRAASSAATGRIATALAGALTRRTTRDTLRSLGLAPADIAAPAAADALLRSEYQRLHALVQTLGIEEA